MLIGPGSFIKAGVTVVKPLPPPTYSLTTSADNVNEGTALTFNVTTTAVPDGTTLWWTTGSGGSNMSFGRFSSATGSVTVTSGSASFSITISADDLTSPDQQLYEVFLYKDGPGGLGGVLVDSIIINVNDTSQTPPQPRSAMFKDTSGWVEVGDKYQAVVYNNFFNTQYVDITKSSYPQPQAGWHMYYPNSQDNYNILDVSDGGSFWTIHIDSGNSTGNAGGIINLVPPQPWTFGNTGTIEFWIKPRVYSLSAPGNFVGAIMSQHTGGGTGIDIFHSGGYINVVGGNTSNYNSYTEPDANVWTHIAIVFSPVAISVYYNGTLKPKSSGYVSSGSFTLNGETLTIGKRGWKSNYQYYDGKITNVRINNTIVYSSDFIPTINLTNISGTLLLWKPNDNSLTTDFSSLPLTITNNSATASTDYPNSYVVATVHSLYPAYSNDFYGTNTVAIEDTFDPYGAKPLPLNGWLITNGVIVRSIINTSNIERTLVGSTPIMILFLDSDVDFNSSLTLTIID